MTTDDAHSTLPTYTAALTLLARRELLRQGDERATADIKYVHITHTDGHSDDESGTSWPGETSLDVAFSTRGYWSKSYDSAEDVLRDVLVATGVIPESERAVTYY